MTEIDILYLHKCIVDNHNIPNKNFYLLDTLEILEEYKHVLKIPIRINFFDSVNNSDENDNGNLTKKRELIKQYLIKIKEYNYDKYIDISDSIPFMKKPELWKCSLCESHVFTESTEVEGLIICTNCGHQDEIMMYNAKITHNDSKRINITTKYTYDKKSHFINCCNQFQGKSKNVIQGKIKNTIDPDVIEKISEELIKYNIMTDNADTSKVTKEHISLFLKELKLTKYYGDINYIYHKLTGTPLHDLSNIMEKLLIDFEQFVKCHNKIFPQDLEQKNFNYQLLLYQLLMKNGYKCNPNEFNFLKTTERKSYHDERCRVIFGELGWNYTSLF